jgi:hypothetical protein
MPVTDLERLAHEDDIARAAVAAARERLDAEHRRVAESGLARLRLAERAVDDAVARILADADRHVAERRAQRRRWAEEYQARANRLGDAAADVVATIILERPRKKTL